MLSYLNWNNSDGNSVKMAFKSVFEDLNISRNDFLYLFILTVFSILITYVLINLNEYIGIYCSDVFIYLSNSLVFAGYSSSILYLYLAPFICFLTSILFRLGFLSEISLYLVTGVFCIFGNIGIYVLLKNKFSSLLSLCGAFLFGSFSLNLLWWANGTLDVPAAALSIWVIIFTLLAIDEDSKYYKVAIPLLVLAIFTRYTALFLLPLIVLYYISYHDFFSNLDLLFLNREEFFLKIRLYLKSEEFRNILKSCILALILIILFSASILNYGSNLSFLTQTSTFASGSKGEIIDNAYTNDTFFYLHDFPNFLFSDNVKFDGVIPILFGSNYVSYLLIGLFTIGIFLFIYNLFNSKRKKDFRFDNLRENKLNCELKSDNELKEFNGLSDKDLKSDNELKEFNGLSDKDLKSDNELREFNGLNNKYIKKYFKYFVGILFVLLLFISILSFKINSIITITILLVDLVILFAFLKKNDINRELYSSNILFLAWFLVYFIFFTFLNIKVNRYIITVFPAFIYFVIFAINGILDFASRFKFFEFKKKNLLNIIPIILIIFCIFSAFTFPSTVHLKEDFNKNKVIADYLIQYDSNYASKDVAVFNQRSYNWFLKMYTIPLTDNQLSFLESSDIDYYISDDNFKLENYTMIYNKNGLYLYERIN
ncbi:hypothetical protein YLM1_1335 [Methanobrevibacter olleyae]|uniref:Glycosyltransferase RgtA/B/C/D-like domain-containing protein n=2 Tax=Methanobrevibacter olleyae TaxID=294671 RepID=A0A126R1E5_METOL|nr:hypothetical protein YLM1_1335 [Methanobrevibacter olleyae]